LGYEVSKYITNVFAAKNVFEGPLRERKRKKKSRKGVEKQEKERWENEKIPTVKTFWLRPCKQLQLADSTVDTLSTFASMILHFIFH